MILGRLATPRLLLRPVMAADAAVIVEHLADWDVVRWLSVVPSPYTAKDAAEFVAIAAPGGQLAQDGEATWAIAEARRPDRLLGVMALGEELGYWLGREAWGRGLATEAAGAVLAAHFADAAAGYVASGYFDGNLRSERVLRKIGFVDDGSRRQDCLARGEDVTCHRMRLTRQAFAAA